VLAFSGRQADLKISWFAQQTGPCYMDYYRQFTTDPTVNKAVVVQKESDDINNRPHDFMFRQIQENNNNNKKKQ
jgi:hypothetical protein